MPGKIPGTPRKTTSKKSTAKPSSTVTPIDLGTGPSSASNAYPTNLQEQIRIRAYELYEERGRQEGFHDEDWARAEAEILSRYQKEKSA
jgi:hypothetical protein